MKNHELEFLKTTKGVYIKLNRACVNAIVNSALTMKQHLPKASQRKLERRVVNQLTHQTTRAAKNVEKEWLH